MLALSIDEDREMRGIEIRVLTLLYQPFNRFVTSLGHASASLADDLHAGLVTGDQLVFRSGTSALSF